MRDGGGWDWSDPATTELFGGGASDPYSRGAYQAFLQDPRYWATGDYSWGSGMGSEALDRSKLYPFTFGAGGYAGETPEYETWRHWMGGRS